MGRRTWLTIGWLAGALVFATAARAQDAIGAAVGRPVAAIHFEVEGRSVTSPDLETLIPIKAGDPLHLDAVREAESHLLNAGRYEDVEVFFTESPGGLDLLFRLTPRHPVDRLEFVDDTGLPPADLNNLVRERFGGIPARESPEAVAQVVEGLLRDEGFPGARAVPNLEVTHDPDRATLVLHVSAGPRPVIARTQVKGASPLAAGKIIAQTGATPGQPFRRRVVEARLAEIADNLRKLGYYSAIADIPSEPGLADDKRGLLVTLEVEAGPRVTLLWDGPRPEGNEEDFVPMAREQSVDADLLEDSDQRVASYWRKQGYRDVDVSHKPERLGDQLVITMHTVRGLKYLVDDVKITGNAHMTAESVRATLGVKRGDPYDETRLAQGLLQLRSTYLRLGYSDATVTPLDPEDVPGSRSATDVHVVVRVNVNEGLEHRIRQIAFAGIRSEGEPPLRRLMTSQEGGPYDLAALLRDKAELESYYRNQGYESVAVGITPTPTADPRILDVVVAVNEGPQITIGDIRVVGNRGVADKAIKERLTLQVDKPYGPAAREESLRRLSNLGLFRLVNIDEEPRASGETRAHVIVTVEELPATTISPGVGFEGGRRALQTASGQFEDKVVVAPRGFFEISRRNLWGKNRSIDFFSRVAPQLAKTTAGNFGFVEYRVSGTYREPNAFGSQASVLLGVASEQAARTGFNFARKSANIEFLRRAFSHVSLTGRYGLEYTRLFDVDSAIIGTADRVTIDRLFPQVRLSILSAGAVWDRRDDLVDPGRGSFTSADVELAARSLGSEVGFTKAFFQTSAFHTVAAARRVVLAGRAELGLARGFERTQVDVNTGKSVTVADLPISQRFFAGGSQTVRGFELDRLGVPSLITSDGLSLGGNGMVVLNAEVRATIGKVAKRDFGAVAFVDAGNVFSKAADIDLAALRSAYGVGIRYNSPFGPLRVDLGIKTAREIIGGTRERAFEWHFSLGETF